MATILAGPAKASRPLRRLLDGVHRLDARSQAKLVGPIASAPKSRAARASRAIVGSPEWRRFDRPQRIVVAEVFHGARANPAAILAVAKGGTAAQSLGDLAQDPQRLMAQDAEGATLLDGLTELAGASLHPAFQDPGARSTLLESVLSEVAHPENVDQSAFGTCGPTSIQYELVQDHPAEYARLMVGLAGPNGSAPMRAGGVLELQTDYLGPDSNDRRSLSEVIFQSAAMEFANGPADYQAGLYERGRGASVGKAGTWGGLYSTDAVCLMDALFADRFNVWLTKPENVEHQLQILRAYNPAGPNSPLLFAVMLGNPPIPNTEHYVTFVRHQDGRIVFRNPWGPSRESNGTESGEYGWRLEDARTGLYSMSEEEFRRRASFVTLPISAYQVPGPQPVPAIS